MAKDFYVDLSQSVDRKPWRHGTFPTYTTASIVYSYEHDARIEPEEVMAMYGRPFLRGHHLARDDIQDLVGNCMAAQPVSTLLHAFLLSVGRALPGLWL